MNKIGSEAVVAFEAAELSALLEPLSVASLIDAAGFFLLARVSVATAVEAGSLLGCSLADDFRSSTKSGTVGSFFFSVDVACDSFAKDLSG